MGVGGADIERDQLAFLAIFAILQVRMLATVRRFFLAFWQRARGELVFLDLGTDATKISVPGKPVRVVPTVALVHRQTQDVLVTGAKAEPLLGKVSAQFEIVKPIAQGAVANGKVLEQFLRNLIAPSEGQMVLPYWRLSVVVACSPLISPAHKQQLVTVCKQVGVAVQRCVDTGTALQASVAAQVQTREPLVILDVGAAVTNIVIPAIDWSYPPAVSTAIQWGGQMVTDIIKRNVRTEYGCDIGWQTAEHIKMQVSVLKQATAKNKSASDPVVTVRGLAVQTQLPISQKVSARAFEDDVQLLYKKLGQQIKHIIHTAAKKHDTPLTGIYLTGGASQTWGLASFLESELTLPIVYATSPVTDVLTGLREESPC